MHSSRRSPAPRTLHRAAHRPIDPSSPLAQPCRIEHNTELLGPADNRHALGTAGQGSGPDRATRAHMHPAARRPCRTRNCGSRARLLLLLLMLLLPLACSCCCCCCCCCTHPPWRTPTSRGHIRVTRGVEPRRALVRAPPCAHNFGTCALATAWSVADDSQLSEHLLFL